MSMAKPLAAKPMCGRCGKPVESFTEERDEWTDCIVWIARCHGKREVVKVPSEVLQAARGLELGVAFRGQRAIEGGDK